MIAGRYTLEREIGRGGAGVVHLGRDEVLGRPVAIKRMGLLPGTTEDDVVRAEREARHAAGINHPHVVSILDLVKDDDCYWLVMEHVEGRTLTELIGAEGPLPDARAAGIIAQAADALVEASKAGIVHRDVKPSNVMVSDDDHAKLADFGIARSADDAALTRTGLVTGSPAYIAPEVASGSSATAASDVWSLGATLHHAVVGRAPYDMGDNVLGGLYRIVHDDPPRLPEDHPLAEVMAAMMQKDPALRWPVARVRDELRRVARGEGGAAVHDPAPDHETTRTMAAVPVAPAPPPPAPTPVQPVSRTTGGRGLPGARLLAVAVLALLVGLGAWLWWPEDGDTETAAETAGTGQGRQPQPSEEAPASPDPTEEPSAQPTEEPTQEPTEEPTQEPTQEPTEEPANDAALMRAFVEDYFAQVTSDPESTFERLTPRFQAESGGVGDYAGFWRTIASATVSDVRADPSTLTTSYTIQYVTTSGRTSTQQGRLLLEESDGSYLIADEG